MREYKFRGKRIDNGDWVYGGYVKEHRDNSHMIFTNEFGAYNAGFKPRREDYMLSCYEIIPETIGQCTGLKDKNGVEIYEGDIIMFKNNYPWGGEYCIRKMEYSGNMFSPTGMVKWSYEDTEVIGNIYENKNLLQGVADER